MNQEHYVLNDQEIMLVLQALGELPARVSYSLIQRLSEEVAAINRRRMAAQPEGVNIDAVHTTKGSS